MKAFTIHYNKRRKLTEDEEFDKAYMGAEYWPPWMETGSIRTCLNCGRRTWEYITLPDECEGCGKVDVRTDQPNWWEKLVHWYLADKRFTGKDAARQAKEGEE